MEQVRNLREAALVSFRADVASLRARGSNLKDAVTNARADAEARFSDGAQEAVVTEGDATWQWEEELWLLQEKIQSIADQLRRDKIKVCNSQSNESMLMLISAT